MLMVFRLLRSFHLSELDASCMGYCVPLLMSGYVVILTEL